MHFRFTVGVQFRKEQETTQLHPHNGDGASDVPTSQASLLKLSERYGINPKTDQNIATEMNFNAEFGLCCGLDPASPVRLLFVRRINHLDMVYLVPRQHF